MRRTIIRVMYILMGVQIAFGAVYFVTNFSAQQQFAESYHTFLPPGMAYLLQFSAAAGSVWYFVGRLGFGKYKFERIWACGFLLTVPFLLQLHMAKLLWSFALSAFLWMWGLMMEIIGRGSSRKRVYLLMAAYFLYGVICPDGLWLGAILLLALSVRLPRGRKRPGEGDGSHTETSLAYAAGKSGGNFRFRAAVLLTAGILFLTNLGLNSAFPKARNLYRENNLGTAAVSRFVWPNFASNYFFWSGEVKAVLSEEEAIQTCQRIDLIEKEFYPALVSAYGGGKATKLCLEMGYRCLLDRSRETVAEIGRDFADYLLIPFTIEKNLQGRGVSLTAWNYGRMKAHTPLLVKYYYRYGIFELPILLLGSLLLWLSQKKNQISQWGPLLFVGILYTLWYTMKSNLPIDYKQVLPILFLWYLASVGGLLCQKPEN